MSVVGIVKKIPKEASLGIKILPFSPHAINKFKRDFYKPHTYDETNHHLANVYKKVEKRCALFKSFCHHIDDHKKEKHRTEHFCEEPEVTFCRFPSECER